LSSASGPHRAVPSLLPSSPTAAPASAAGGRCCTTPLRWWRRSCFHTLRRPIARLRRLLRRAPIHDLIFSVVVGALFRCSSVADTPLQALLKPAPGPSTVSSHSVNSPFVNTILLRSCLSSSVISSWHYSTPIYLKCTCCLRASWNSRRICYRYTLR
jgi:hypothetical protein